MDVDGGHILCSTRASGRGLHGIVLKVHIHWTVQTVHEHIQCIGKFPRTESTWLADPFDGRRLPESVFVGQDFFVFLVQFQAEEILGDLFDRSIEKDQCGSTVVFRQRFLFASMMMYRSLHRLSNDALNVGRVNDEFLIGQFAVDIARDHRRCDVQKEDQI